MECCHFIRKEKGGRKRRRRREGKDTGKRKEEKWTGISAFFCDRREND